MNSRQTWHFSHLVTATVQTWSQEEKERIAALPTLEGVAAGVPLWDDVFARLDEHVQVNALALRSAIMSTQSAVGGSAERLFAHVAAQLIKENRTLTAFHTDVEFQTAIRRLRSQDGTVEQVATKFYLNPEFVELFVAEPRKAVTYPDTVSVFRDGQVLLGEHKLTGDNDSKAVAKNLEVLHGLRTQFIPPVGGQVRTAVILPFTRPDQAYAARWRKRRPVSPDVVACNEEVWETLFREQGITVTEHASVTAALADVASTRVKHLIGV